MSCVVEMRAFTRWAAQARDIVEGGNTHTRRRVAKCIGGRSADHTDVREVTPTLAKAGRKVVHVAQGASERAEGLAEMRRRIQEAREGHTRQEVAGYVGRGGEEELGGVEATDCGEAAVPQDRGVDLDGWLDEDEEAAIMGGLRSECAGGRADGVANR